MHTKMTIASPRPQWSHITMRYAAAVVIVAVAAILQKQLVASFGSLPAHVVFYPAVFLITTIGGGGPGILATILSALSVDYWLIESIGHFTVELPNIIDLGIFIGGNLFLCVIMMRLRSAHQLAFTHEMEFRLLAEALPQIVWITRPDGGNIYFNHQWTDYTGLTLGESYGDGWNKPFHPDDRKRAWDAWQNAVINNANYSLECQLRRKDGTYRWWLIRGVPAHNEKGEIIRWFGTCTDIHEMKLTEKSFQQMTEQRTRLFFQTLLDGFFTVNKTGRFTEINDTYVELIGHSRDELLTMSLQDVEALETESGVLLQLQRVIQDGQARFESQHRRKNGQIMDVEISASYLPSNDEIFVFTRDITERKRSETMLRQSELRLRRFYESGMIGVFYFDIDGKITAEPTHKLKFFEIFT